MLGFFIKDVPVNKQQIGESPKIIQKSPEEVHILPLPVEIPDVTPEEVFHLPSRTLNIEKKWDQINGIDVVLYDEPVLFKRLSYYDPLDSRQTRHNTDGIGASWISLEKIYKSGYIGIALPREFQSHLDVEYGDALVLEIEWNEQMVVVVADTMNQRYEWVHAWDIAIVWSQSDKEKQEIQDKWQKVGKSKNEITIVWKIKNLWKKISR